MSSTHKHHHTQRTQYTAEAAQELFQSAADELAAACDPFEVHDLRTWRQKFTCTVNLIAEHRGDELDAGATTPLDGEE